ncbi:choice-of-anchor J domain-containing protein, partial [Myroides indicus]
MENTHEVLLSTTGIDLSSFTRVLKPMTVYLEKDYVKEVIYLEGLTGDVNLAWHVKMEGETVLLIDNLRIEEVDCVAPEIDLEIGDIKSDEVTLQWDSSGDDWEYYLQPAWGKEPSGLGTSLAASRVVVKSLNDGTALQGNTEYEVYVRFKCSGGTFGLWEGPYRFKTPCDAVYQVPFWEGFNSSYWKYDSKSLDCWTIINHNKDQADWREYGYNAYEGDQAMHFVNFEHEFTHDDWLISPKIELTGGNYILKYHYKTDQFYNTSFEVLLSSSGTDPADFTMVLLPKKTYTNDSYVEQQVYISGISAEVHLAWHIVGEGGAIVYLDNVFVVEAGDCPDPTLLTSSAITSNSAEVSWNQPGGVTQWEVYVAAYGEGTPDKTTVAMHQVKGSPKITLSGLAEGTAYTVYVRAVCEEGGFSNWSSPLPIGTLAGANGNCLGAQPLVVNKG